DAFSFAILDFTLTPLPTTGLGDALLLVNINQMHPGIETFRTTEDSPFELSAPEITAVPETGSSISMLLIGLGAVWRFRRRFFTSHSTLGLGSGETPRYRCPGSGA